MDRFVTNYVRFFEELKTITPELFAEKKVVLPEEDTDKLDLFVRNWYPHMENVSNANIKFFQENKINPELFKNLNFLSLIEKVSTENRNIIWEYLHTLYALSVTTSPLKNNYSVDDASEEDKELFTAIKKTVANFPTLIGNMVSWKRENKPKPEKPKASPKFDEKFMENSALGKLAKQISEELDPAEIQNMGIDMKNMDDPMKLFQSLMSGDKDNGIGKLMTSVTDKLKVKMESGEVNQDEIFKEATSLLQTFSGGMPGMPSGGTGSGGLDMASMMSMAQNLSAMGDLFGGQTDGSSQGRSRKIKRRIKRKLKKKK